MSKPDNKYRFFIALAVGWLCFVGYLWVSANAVVAGLYLLFAAASLALIHRQLDFKPRQRIAEIEYLVQMIDRQMDEDPKPILLANVPTEVRPLVQSLNALIRFQMDRYQQERDFTAHASHELRTPLSGIRLQTEIAMMTEDPVQRNNALNNVLKAVDRGTRLVEQLLVLSRLTLDKLELDVSTVDVSALCQQKVLEYKSAAQKKSIQLTYSQAATSWTLTASEISLDILLDNLLRNAITHTPIDGDIHILVREKDDNMVIEVSDTGPGIPKADHQRVFSRFQKASRAGKSSTGLGLSIVKRVVDLHRGNIDLTSSEQNHGLRVIVELPLDRESTLNFDSDIAENTLQQVKN